MNKVGRPLAFKSKEELEEKIENYFADCEARDEQPFITELAVWLDVDTETLRNYEKKDEYFGTIKRAKQKCEMAVEKNMMTNKFNATASIFNLKNNYGWEDRIKQDNTHNVDPEVKEQLDNALDDV